MGYNIWQGSLPCPQLQTRGREAARCFSPHFHTMLLGEGYSAAWLNIRELKQRITVCLLPVSTDELTRSELWGVVSRTHHNTIFRRGCWTAHDSERHWIWPIIFSDCYCISIKYSKILYGHKIPAQIVKLLLVLEDIYSWVVLLNPVGIFEQVSVILPFPFTPALPLFCRTQCAPFTLLGYVQSLRSLFFLVCFICMCVYMCVSYICL